MHSMLADLLAVYLLVGLLFVGLPLAFFVLIFSPGLMRTVGETIGESEYMKPGEPLLGMKDDRQSLDKVVSRVGLSDSRFKPHKERTFENTA